MRNTKPRKHNILMIIVLIASFCFIVWDFITPHQVPQANIQENNTSFVNKTK